MAPPPERLRTRAEFLRAAQHGRKAAVHGLVLQVRPRGDDDPVRVGFTVTRKVGNAVVRNRTKRRLREAARLLLAGRALPGTDLVLIGRDATRSRPFALLLDDLARALDKAGAARPDAAGAGPSSGSGTAEAATSGAAAGGTRARASGSGTSEAGTGGAGASGSGAGRSGVRAPGGSSRGRPPGAAGLAARPGAGER